MRRASLAAFVVVVAAPAVHAQCTDGTPPPCRTASAATRRADPPLDDKTWIVVPFAASGSGDIGWLRDASVNLLYADLSQWSDIRVIDDERVADLVRDVPSARGPTISLEAALIVARRAGARHLVMGDVLQVGRVTRITAKVYDVRGGQRVRTLQGDAASQDSIIPAFARLAGAVLDIGTRTGSSAAAIGTTNVQALRDYVAGTVALHRFDIPEARRLFLLAIKSDSTFALAHYKYAIAGGWEPILPDSVRTRHAVIAARLSGSLPDRMRALTSALVAFHEGDFPRSCDLYGRLVAEDSSHIDALYGLGECNFHDNQLVRLDSARFRYRGSWNHALRAFRRALVVDPSFHQAYQHIIDILTRSTRSRCIDAPGAERICVGVVVRRGGDSLVYEPVVREGSVEHRAQEEAARTDSAYARNLAAALRVAMDWVDHTAEQRARASLAVVVELTGDLSQFEAHLARIGPPHSYPLLRRLFERDVKTGRADDASARYAAMARIADSLGSLPAKPETALVQHQAADAWAYGPIVGRFITPSGGLEVPNGREADAMRMLRLQAGVPIDSIERIDAIAEASFVSLIYAISRPRRAWPQSGEVFGDATVPLNSEEISRKNRPAVALSRGDTAGFRAGLDSLNPSVARMDDGSSILFADGYLMLRDSLPALNTLRRLLDSLVPATPLLRRSINPYFLAPAAAWPRAMLLRADLAAALGFRDEADTWYGRFISLWEKGDPEIQPIVARARAAKAALARR